MSEPRARLARLGIDRPQFCIDGGCDDSLRAGCARGQGLIPVERHAAADGADDALDLGVGIKFPLQPPGLRIERENRIAAVAEINAVADFERRHFQRGSRPLGSGPRTEGPGQSKAGDVLRRQLIQGRKSRAGQRAPIGGPLRIGAGLYRNSTRGRCMLAAAAGVGRGDERASGQYDQDEDCRVTAAPGIQRSRTDFRPIEATLNPRCEQPQSEDAEEYHSRGERPGVGTRFPQCPRRRGHEHETVEQRAPGTTGPQQCAANQYQQSGADVIRRAAQDEQSTAAHDEQHADQTQE